MPTLKNLTILHSNDLHGDFHADEIDEDLLGGISMLSGYVAKVRSEVPNTIYCIAGDMLQGSIIDSDYLGLSTIEIMNLLNPDVASIGNHEIDYGLAHLLFLERCAKFPIVNANFYIKNPYTRLFKPCKVIRMDGMNIKFIGITTEDIMKGIQSDFLGSFVDIEDAACEVGHICNAYKSVDIDFTVLLTHIGFEEDKRLAAMLDPEWGVDLIIGGHTHTILEQPEMVNGILIAQAGVGTKQIGRFDIVVDTDANVAHDFSWELISIKAKNCPRDIEMENTVLRFKDEVDQKYDRVLCRLKRRLTHPDRYQETELGNLLCDILQKELGVDIMMLGSGSIRKKAVPTIMTLREMHEMFPYDDKLKQFSVTGDQFKRMLAFIFREEMFNKDHTEFYQFSRGLKIRFNRARMEFESIELNGAPLQHDGLYTIGLQDFHIANFSQFFGFPIEELLENAKPRVLTTSAHDIFLEHFATVAVLKSRVEGRIVVVTD